MFRFHSCKQQSSQHESVTSPRVMALRSRASGLRQRAQEAATFTLTPSIIIDYLLLNHHFLIFGHPFYYS